MLWMLNHEIKSNKKVKSPNFDILKGLTLVVVIIFGDCIMRCVITLLSMSVSVSILTIYVTLLSISKFKFT